MTRSGAGAGTTIPDAGARKKGSGRAVARPPDGFNLPPGLDAALLGYVILGDLATADVTGEWFEAPQWQRAARALLKHRAQGGTLGDLITAGRVLTENQIDFGMTLAAEAVMATSEVANAQVIVDRARRRLPRLRLRRLAKLLEVTSGSEPAAMFRIVRSVARRTLRQIERELLQ